MAGNVLKHYSPLLGEMAWHSITLDPTVSEVSNRHRDEVVQVLGTHWNRDHPPSQVLEVASYAHTTGYTLGQELNAQVTLFDVSARALRLGRRLAGDSGQRTRLVAGDFHEIPFEDEAFDLVFMHSALHHTWQWQTLLGELRRILTPGGLLYLGNEPIQRSCCFYKFRTNRPADFTRFEKGLQELGLIYTVAEPYLGSRPESLFGVVENQKIPAQDLQAELERDCEVLEARFIPEGNMSKLDWSWARKSSIGAKQLELQIAEQLRELCAQAEDYLDETARGLGFSLPTEIEIQKLARRVGPEVSSLPSRLSPRSYRRALSEIFGAATAWVARKEGPRRRPPSGAFRSLDSEPAKTRNPSVQTLNRRKKPVQSSVDYPKDDGVYLAFPPKLSHLVEQSSSLVNIQEDDEERVFAHFPREYWLLQRQDEIVTLSPVSDSAPIQLPQSQRERLLVVRFYGSPPSGQSGEIWVTRLGETVFQHRLWLAESFLCVIKLAKDNGDDSEIFVHGRAEGSSDDQSQSFAYNVTYAGLFDIE